MQNKNKLSFLIVLVFFLLGFFLIYTPPHKGDMGGYSNIKYVKIAGQNIKVDLSITPAEHAQGLSGREVLKEDEGMLFVFEKPDKYDFWMKDMNFPIDIIWLAPSDIGGDSSEAKVIYIKKDARPELYPETYGPDANSKYVLEVVAGFSEKYNLKEGDRAELQ